MNQPRKCANANFSSSLHNFVSKNYFDTFSAIIKLN